MKIVSYEKKGIDKYKVKLDNDDVITLYDNVILNNNLLITKEIEDIDKLLKENDFYELYNKTIRYLGTKLRTRKEIYNHFKIKYDRDTLNDVLDRITKEGYLNDDLYVKSYVADQVNLSNNGYYKILRDLTNKDIDESLIKQYLDEVEDSTWINKITKLVEKKIKSNNKYSSSYLKEKILYDLNTLGYDKTMILDVISNYDIKDDEDIFNKTYESIYNKLSKKYSGNELKVQLINKLMSKGFKYSEIKNKIK